MRAGWTGKKKKWGERAARGARALCVRACAPAPGPGHLPTRPAHPAPPRAGPAQVSPHKRRELCGWRVDPPSKDAPEGRREKGRCVVRRPHLSLRKGDPRRSLSLNYNHAHARTHNPHRKRERPSPSGPPETATAKRGRVWGTRRVKSDSLVPPPWARAKTRRAPSPVNPLHPLHPASPPPHQRVSDNGHGERQRASERSLNPLPAHPPSSPRAQRCYGGGGVPFYCSLLPSPW